MKDLDDVIRMVKAIQGEKGLKILPRSCEETLGFETRKIQRYFIKKGDNLVGHMRKYQVFDESGEFIIEYGDYVLMRQKV